MYYKSLFNLNIHHGYFLDKGAEKFLTIESDDDKMSKEDKEASLKEYDFSEYLILKPTQSTQRIFKNYKVVLRKHSEGFRLLANTLENETKYEPIIPFENDVTFTFELQSTDPYFHNYTELSIATEPKLYLFTNIKPNGQEDSFETISENKGGPIDSRFLLTKEASRALITTIAAEDESFASIDGQFTITHSIQFIEEDETLSTNEKESKITDLLNQFIQRKKQQRVVGYVRLTIKGDGDIGLLDFNEGQQTIKETTPEFTISFINRKTFWRFYSSSDDIILTTKNKKWLSKNGFTEIIGKSTDDDPSDFDPEPEKEYTFPNPTIESITNKDNIDYSEIFI
ncbi:MAG: hypothetical protein JKY02_06650 [Flavobacteriaceae bacterium]|nr:hypothetical protein [Flavobacteriaceae bacterium]